MTDDQSLGSSSQDRDPGGSEVTPRQFIKDLSKLTGVDEADLVIQSKKRDAMMAGTPGQKEKGRWAADLWRQAVESRATDDERIHPRGIHYFIVEMEGTIESPTERTSWTEYRNTERCYNYLRESLEEARKLGLIPLDGVRDQKHDQKTVREYGPHRLEPDLSAVTSLPTGVDLPPVPDEDDEAELAFDAGEVADHVADQLIADLRERIHFDTTRLRAYHLEVWCEKTLPAGDRIREILPDLGVNVLVEGEGDLTYGLAADLCHRLKTAEKPAVIFYLSDFDARGHQMPEGMAAKLAWLDKIGELPERVVLEPMALTHEQVQEHDFTRSPIPEGEAKGGEYSTRGAKAYDTLVNDWEQRMGEGAVELNVFENHPDLFESIIRERISDVLDHDLGEKRSDALDAWEEDLRDAVDDAVADSYLDSLEDDVEAWVKEFNNLLRELDDELQRLRDKRSEGPYDEWRDTVREVIAGMEFPQPDPPEGEAPMPEEPLYDSSREYLRNVQQVQRHRHGE